MKLAGRLSLVWIMRAGLILMIGCSSFSAGGSEYRNVVAEAGEGSLYDVNLMTLRIFNRFQYEPVRQEESPQMISYFSNWKYRIPFDDELSLGIIEARTRIIVRARLRRVPNMTGGYKMYQVKVEAENWVLFADTDVWTATPNSVDYVKYVRGFARDLETELRMTIYKL